jgi:hypothetical protein
MFRPRGEWIREVALLCCVLLVPGDVPLVAQQPAPAPADAAAAAPITPDQLDSLVAPIALYPDPLLAQVLAASTYPLEMVQLRQWLDKHKGLKDKALADAVKKENWDPSIQSMAALPDVVKQMEENIKWTSELGNAFLAQESGVMDAIQRMRAKAKDAGKLTSNEQMKVETKVVESKTVVVIEQSNPQVVYVPSYDPVVVWGVAPVYAYPPIVYPAGYYAAGVALSFGVGLAMGAMWGGGWGYGCGWGGNNTININNNNNFNRNSNRTNNIGNGSGNRGNGNRANGGNWQHNPQHRGGAPYGDRSTANKFGGTTRGDSAGNRQASARQNAGERGGGAGVGDRSGGAGSGNSFRSNGGGAGGAGSAANRGGDNVGNRQTSGGGGSRGSSSGAFGGGGSGMSGSSARSSSSRGSSSMGGGASRGGGGGARSGGGGGRRR